MLALPTCLWHVSQAPSPRCTRLGTGGLLPCLSGMIDQLASIDVEFDGATIARIFTHLARWRTTNSTLHTRHRQSRRATQLLLLRRLTIIPCKVLPAMKEWAVDPIYKNNAPVRPQALGAILSSESFMFKVSGYNLRTPMSVPIARYVSA
ncbi:hypothetical protein B0T25DRAFT_159820 [Lasiosphaeria hispida]|uniref:Uncharacterized protein n=1 Tax=Lasiosphaeria hispida TaxID=260671 RepID=A0AAJ0MG83_9PEZI|nr:hypothetical protein B0T25DRAFT_159820 [Lasiosphaeria hispida]